MTKLRFVAFALAGFSLSGCSMVTNIWDVKDLRTARPVAGTPFTVALTSEYRIQADHKADDRYEWNHASIYARKGLRASRGEMVLPEEVGAWPMPPARAAELSAARGRLMQAFANGARERVPAAAARSQALFDCWVIVEWELHTPSHCMRDFLASEGALMIVTAQPSVVVPAPAQRPYQVFFDWDQSAITPAAAQIIRQAADNIRQGRATMINVTGHTDTSGSSAYNDGLSQRRAAAVAEALAQNGIPRSAIRTVGVGESGLLVETPDGVREPQNRRAEIGPS